MRALPFVFAMAMLLMIVGGALAAPPGEANAPARALAEAYGIEGWGNIERIDFTFNVDLPGKDETVSRAWTWWPKQGKVRQRFASSNEEPITFKRREVAKDASEAVRQADKQFINDHYWLLFPFQPVWSNPAVKDEGGASLPIGEGEARKLVVQYPSEGGYTPGDAYWLYLNDENRIVQWQYLPGGDADKAMVHTWEKHRKLGPIVVSLDHWGPNKKFHLWFTDVKAKLVSGNTVTPEPFDN